jgi:hypothetical protein
LYLENEDKVVSHFPSLSRPGPAADDLRLVVKEHMARRSRVLSTATFSENSSGCWEDEHAANGRKEKADEENNGEPGPPVHLNRVSAGEKRK